MQLAQNQTRNQRKFRQNQKNAKGLEESVSLKLNQFEQRFSATLEQRFNPVSGNLCRAIEHELTLLEELEETKKSKQVIFTLPEKITKDLLQNFKDSCQDLILHQKQEATKCIKVINREINKFLDSYQLKKTSPLIEIIEDREIQHLLHHRIVFDKHFSGTMANRGLMEYIMGARMYFMYVMMGASMLGFSIRRNPTMKNLMAPLAILLVGLGIYQVWSSKQSEKEEQSEKHLQSAKDFITNQFKKIGQEVSKKMDKLIAEKVRKEAHLRVENATQLLQSKLEMEQKKVEIKKIKTERILKNISTQEKNLETIVRSQATFEKNLHRLKAEIKKQLNQQIISSLSPPAESRNQPSRRSTRPVRRSGIS